MDILPFLKAATQTSNKDTFETKLTCEIVTNFTDDLLKKILTGMCLSDGIYPDIFAVPFGQYHLQLQDPASDLRTRAADLTFIFFDASPYVASEFTSDPSHGTQIIAGIERLAEGQKDMVVCHTLIEPALTPHGNLHDENALVQGVRVFNQQLQRLTMHTNIHVLDTNRFVRKLGEVHSRDLRSLYAFHNPFTHAFLGEIAFEWRALINARLGKNRKAIVVDLDNTLWGGVVGEVGPLGIQLGTDYPGNAFLEFQRLLLDYYERGIILAINSRNNPDDVKEVFEKNPYMILQPRHFSVIMSNWNNKAENLIAIAKEINIGLDGTVFLDDDAMNRDLVRSSLPEVLVPDLSGAPETYPATLLSLKAFHTLQLTEEDKQRGQMYAQERQRKEAQITTQSMEEYICQLKITCGIAVNHVPWIARLSQLTLKTNQFNCTTKRYTEQEIQKWMKRGLVIAADIKDRFGGYGITIESIVQLEGNTATIDTFLQSCRVMGRGIEFAFLEYVFDRLKKQGIKHVYASFAPTKKNAPAADFFVKAGFTPTSEHEDKSATYVYDLSTFTSKPTPITLQEIVPYE